MNMREALADLDEDLLFMDPESFDEAIIGYIERANSPPVVCYNKDKVLEILMKDGMDWEEAEEYYNYNIVDAWVGERTPTFLNIYD
jgi:hypothetical protein